MSEDSNPVKEALFEHIRGSDAVRRMVAEQRFGDATRDIAASCHGMVEAVPGGTAALATGMLHYLLTEALIPSQRKVELRGVGLDVVVPDAGTLGRDPAKALVIAIPEQTDPGAVRDVVAQLRGVQPVRDNVWVVLPRDMDAGARTFILGRDGGSFCGIIPEIFEFVRATGAGRFRIFGA